MNSESSRSLAYGLLSNEMSCDMAVRDSDFTARTAFKPKFTYMSCSASSRRFLHPRLIACSAFLATVFASMAAAASVAIQDVSLLLGGF